MSCQSSLEMAGSQVRDASGGMRERPSKETFQEKASCSLSNQTVWGCHPCRPPSSALCHGDEQPWVMLGLLLLPTQLPCPQERFQSSVGTRCLGYTSMPLPSCVVGCPPVPGMVVTDVWWPNKC